MTALLTADEAARLVPGEQLVIVRPGDERRPDWWDESSAEFLAPQTWVTLTGPCRTCDGAGELPSPNDWPEARQFDMCGNPDCRDGRRIEPLYAECSYAFGTVPGRVLVGWGSIEVVPVVDEWAILESPYIRVQLGQVQLRLVDTHDGKAFPDSLALDPLPVPGRDYGIIIDCVEVNAEQYEKRKETR